MNSLRETRDFEIKSVHPFTSALESMLLFERYTRRFEEGLAFYKNYMEAARRIDAKILVLHGQRLGAGSLSDREYCDHYRTLYRLGQSLGVTVAQENVRLFRSASPEFIAVMRRELGDECAFVLDTKQTVMSGYTPAALCRAMGSASSTCTSATTRQRKAACCPERAASTCALSARSSAPSATRAT